jgi:hypothetical protein
VGEGSEYRLKNRSIWPETAVGTATAATLLVFSVVAILGRNPNEYLGIPGQMVLAVLYCLAVGAVCGLVLGLVGKTVDHMARALKLGIVVQIAVTFLSTLLAGGSISILVPWLHGAEFVSTLPFFVGGILFVGLIQTWRIVTLSGVSK